MSTCAIKWCGKNSKKSNKKTDGITFHRFPRDGHNKEAWILATKRTNWFPSKQSVVCSRHFTEDCFLEQKNHRRLLINAIPTKYLPALIEDEVLVVQPSKSVPATPNSTSITENIDQPPTWFVPIHDTTSETKHNIDPPPSSNSAVSATPDGTRKSIIEEPSEYDSMNNKRFRRRIIELSGMVTKKNVQLRNLRAKVKYCRKRIADLESVIKQNGLDKKSVVDSKTSDVDNSETSEVDNSETSD